MLIDEHSNTDATHEETIQEILDILFGFGVYAICLLQLQYTLFCSIDQKLIIIYIESNKMIFNYELICIFC